ncbi:MAG TPA: sulfotransferase [Salinivirga sp.]|uniref:sulfotransferase family protein n=1 Tax=Salinivirga sp. TaxID=1970192 RepID=UPI002B4780A5|nr:sulfotransferase [Salinivirga sp.]HKK57920.1 sulfotransferase [Salinivirga sp.]
MKSHKPNFFIVGAAKAGTTSLYQYLNTHSNLYFSPVKEPHFFSTDIKTSEFTSIYKRNIDNLPQDFYQNKPKDSIQNVFIRDEKQYLNLFQWADGESAVGECSTSYLYSKEAAKNVKKFNPDAKIVIALRNPADRTFSHYLMAVRFGFTQLPFRKALHKDFNQHKKGWGKSELFIELSLYYEQIKRYMAQFPEEQIKIVLFDEFKKDPLSTVNEICDFLGIDKFSDIENKKHNAALMPKSKNLNRLMVNTGFKSKVSNILGEKAKDKLRQIFFQDDKIPKLSRQDRSYLQGLFKEDIQKTSELINRDLSHWLK